MSRIIAMIPARIGSTRLKMKNLALLNGEPLISYSIKAAMESKIFDRVIINSDNAIFNKIAIRYGAEFYLRPSILGGSEIKSDQVVEDFVKNNPCDIVVWVNPIAPLQTGAKIRDVISHFQKKRLDSLFTIRKEKVHCRYKEKPINYSDKEIFAQTQDLEPVSLYVYSIMMWRTKPFIEKIKKEGHAFYTGRVGYFEIDKENAIIIKDKADLLMAESMIIARNKEEGYETLYDNIIEDLNL